MYVDNLTDHEFEMNLINIYHYFMGTWRHVAKEFEYNEIIARKKGRSHDKATRATKDQTILFYDPAKQAFILNKRKLNELPRLIVQFKSSSLKAHCLRTDVLFNLEFMYAKTLLCDFQFLAEVRETVWTLYRESRYEVKVKESARIQAGSEKGKARCRRMEELLGVFVFYEQFCLMIKENPDSLVEQVRSRMFEYGREEEGKGLACLMGEALRRDGFVNRLRAECGKRSGENVNFIRLLFVCVIVQLSNYLGF